MTACGPGDDMSGAPCRRRVSCAGIHCSASGSRRRRSGRTARSFRPRTTARCARPSPGKFPTEVPAATYDMVVFENKFPSLQRNPPPPAVEGNAARARRAVARRVRGGAVHARPPRDARRSCRSRASSTWCACGATARARSSARDDVVHVFPFENKGAAIGVTLSHPHGQIYAYPFVPPVVLREIERARAHRGGHGALSVLRRARPRARRRPPHRRAKRTAGSRTFRSSRAIRTRRTSSRRAACARCPISTRRRCAGSRGSSSACWWASTRSSTCRSRTSWRCTKRRRPTTPYHLHIEFYPPMRSATRLKYLAGSEAGAGMFINDTLAEEKAAELRAKVPAVPELAEDDRAQRPARRVRAAERPRAAVLPRARPRQPDRRARRLQRRVRAADGDRPRDRSPPRRRATTAACASARSTAARRARVRSGRAAIRGRRGDVERLRARRRARARAARAARAAPTSCCGRPCRSARGCRRRPRSSSRSGSRCVGARGAELAAARARARGAGGGERLRRLAQRRSWTSSRRRCGVRDHALLIDCRTRRRHAGPAAGRTPRSSSPIPA